MEIINRTTTTHQQVTAKIEGKLTRTQLGNLHAVINNTGTTFYSDLKSYLISQLKADYDKVGAGGSHVWCSNKNNQRQVIIEIK